MYIEIFVVAAILVFVYIYRKNTGDNSYKFIEYLQYHLKKMLKTDINKI